MILLNALFLVSINTQAQVIERVVAVVNAEPILESDFTELKKKAQNPLTLNKYLLTKDPASLQQGDRQDLLQYLIAEKIVNNEIKKLGLSVSMERVEQEIKNIAQRNGMTVDALYAQVRAEGLSKFTYQTTMKENLEKQSLLEQEIVPKIRVTDDDALAEYLKLRKDAKTSVDEFTVAHIFFSPEKEGGLSAAQKRASAVLERLRTGEKFETLAQKFSEDPAFANGGLLGTFKTGDFTKEFEEALTPLSPGQTSAVVSSRRGLHILKLMSRRVSSDPRFEKEKEGIKAALLERAVTRQFRIWLQSKREDAFLRINK